MSSSGARGRTPAPSSPSCSPSPAPPCTAPSSGLDSPSRWELDAREKEILTFAQRIFAIRRANPALRRRYFFRGKPVESGAKEMLWLRPDGHEMTDAEWHNKESHSLGMLIRGEAADEIDERGRSIKGDTLLLIVNTREGEEAWALPKLEIPGAWLLAVDTDRPTIVDEPVGELTIAPFSLVLLRFQLETP